MSSEATNPSWAFFLRVRGCADRRLLSSEETMPDALQEIVGDCLEAEGASAGEIAEAREWAGQRAKLLRFLEPWRCISLPEDEGPNPIIWLECDYREPSLNQPSRIR